MDCDAEMTKKALIAWDKLCQPVSTGGLNFINIELWNQAAICKLLWSVCQRKEKMWIIWVHTYYIKGRSVWETSPKNASWMIQKVFKAREYFKVAGYNMTDVQQMDNFHIKGLYQRLQGQFPKVEWRKLILNNQGAPKWKFIFRLAICDRLATRDMIAQWGINTMPLCALCNICNETVEHLLFECEVSGNIWKKVLRWQTIPRGSMVWQMEIQWEIRNCKRKK